MMHEFKVNGEMVEVTVARDGQDWLLGEYQASVLADGRIMVHTPDGRSRILLRLEMFGGFISMDIHSVLRKRKQALQTEIQRVV